MEARTFRLNTSRLARRSSAASLFKGSEALGSRKRNYQSISIDQKKKKKKKKKKKPYLHADNNGIQIQHRLPILAQNIQTHISFHVDIRMVNLLRALDLWRIVGEVLIDREGEVESAALVHAFVGFDGEGKV